MAKKTERPQLKETVRTVIIQPYGYRLRIVVTTDLQQTIEKRHLNVPPNIGAFHAYSPDSMCSTIFLPKEVGPGTVAHEAYHCVWNIMENIGATHENEVIAYTLGFVVEHVYTTLVKADAHK